MWALILGLIIALVVVLGGLLVYLQNLNASVSQELELMQKRATLSTQWHGMVSLDATRLVVQMGTSDEAMSQLMDQEMGTAAITEVQKQVVALVNTPEGKALLEKIATARQQALGTVAKAAAFRQQQDIESASAIVKTTLRPQIDVYVQEIQNFAALQEKHRDQLKQESAAITQQALLVGSAVVALLIVLVLFLSAWLVRSITQPLERAVDLADAIAAGDLTVTVQDDRRDELGHLLRSLNAMGAKLREVVGEVRSGVESVSSAAHQIATGNHDLSARTEQTGIGQVNQAVANLDQMTQQNAALVEEATAAAGAMSEQARRLAQVVAAFNVGTGASTQAVRPAPAAAHRPMATPTGTKASSPAPSKKLTTHQPVAPKSAAPKPAAPKPVAPAMKRVAAPTLPAAKPPAAKPAASSTNEDDWETF